MILALCVIDAFVMAAFVWAILRYEYATRQLQRAARRYNKRAERFAAGKAA